MKKNSKNKPVDIDLVKQYLRYDSETGDFFWKVSRGRVKAGDRAGYLKPSGYVQICLLGEKYLAHRLGYAIYHNDNLDGFEVNHLNHITDDNRIKNLSKSDRFGQNQDKAMHCNNSTGVTGVCFGEGIKNPYRVVIGGKGYGNYLTLEEAKLAAQYVYAGLGYSPNHGRPLADIQEEAQS